MLARRILNWEGCNNVRDLGGLPTRSGLRTRWGALVRSDHPAKLTAAGWEALYAHGIRTIISLRTDGVNEDQPDIVPRPTDITTLNLAIEDLADSEFVERWVNTNLWGTPLYFLDTLKRWPKRHAAVVAAIAHAQPGGVLFHCRRGYDRTGIIAMLLLALVGVAVEDIVTDYELSIDAERDKLVAAHGTTVPAVFQAILESLDMKAYLRTGGLSDTEIKAVCKRLTEPDA